MGNVITMDLGGYNKRGICSECGADAYVPQATKCEEHRGKKAAPKTVKPDTERPEIRVVDPPPPPTNPEDAKTARAKELEVSIKRDLNPVMLQGFAMLCRPIEPQHFYTVDKNGSVTPTDLGRPVMFSDMEAQLMGKAAAELEDSPIAKSATAFAAPMMPIVWGVLGIGTVAFHGYRMFQLRDGLLAAYQQQMAAAEAANAPTEAGPVESETPPNGVVPPFDLPDIREAVNG